MSIATNLAPLATLRPCDMAACGFCGKYHVGPCTPEPRLTDCEILLLRKLARQHGPLCLPTCDHAVAHGLHVPRALVRYSLMVGWCGDLQWWISERGIEALEELNQ